MATIVGKTSAEEKLIGTAEDDIIIGGPGTNILYGRGGRDTFVVDSHLTVTKSTSFDTIKDFEIGIDKVDLSALGISSFSQLKQIWAFFDEAKPSFRVSYNGVDHIVAISNVDVANLSATDFIFDTSGPRTMTGTDNNDTLIGSVGNDTLIGSVGDFDLLYGGDGKDFLDGRPGGNNKLYGGDGDDKLIGSRDELYGGNGNDVLSYVSRANLYGEDGADIFKVATRSAKPYNGTFGTIEDFESGKDKIDLSSWGVSSFVQLKLILETKNGTDAYFNAYYGADYSRIDNNHVVQVRNIAPGDLRSSDFVFASSGPTTKTGTSLDDVIFAGNSGDTLKGGDGWDVLIGGSGNDVLIGGKGLNTLYGLGGVDTFKVGTPFSLDSDNGRAVIGDFEVGKDKLDVSAFGVSSFEQVKLILRTEGKDTILDVYALLGDGHRAITLVNVAAKTLKAEDFIFYTGGAANRTGTYDDDRMFGSRQGDKLDGALGNDEIYGGEGNDRLFGGDGDDKLFGGSGNDVLDGATGSNVLSGGTGTDTFILSNLYLSRMVIVDFETGIDKFDISLLGISSLDQLQAILTAKSKTDTGFHIWINGSFVSLTFNNTDSADFTSRDFIFSNSGPLNFKGTYDDDFYFGSAKADVLKGGEGHDRLLGGNGNDIIEGGLGGDTLSGGFGNDILDGGIGNDTLFGDAGDDTIRGGDGDDKIYTGVGKDFVDGGAGLDTVYFTSKVVLDQTNSANNTGEAQFATYTSIEAFRGSAAADRMTGGALNDSFYGENGNDVLKGMAGNDRLQGGNGDDRLDGGVGNDKVFGGAGNDTLSGGVGKDQIDGGSGDNLIIASSFDDVRGGFDGIDTVVFSNAVTMSLLNSSLNTGEAEGSHYYQIEIFDGSNDDDILIGDYYTETLLGDGGNDALAGMDGRDTLSGGGGDDLLYGGLDSDILTGGKGADVFLYNYAADSKTLDAQRDTIMDFSADDGDLIDLSTIDASTNTAGDQAFIYLGKSAFSGKAGQLRYDKASSDTYIYADVDGDKKADFSIHLDDAVTLSKGYFVL